jgi:hypothetical protein
MVGQDGIGLGIRGAAVDIGNEAMARRVDQGVGVGLAVQEAVHAERVEGTPGGRVELGEDAEPGAVEAGAGGVQVGCS